MLLADLLDRLAALRVDGRALAALLRLEVVVELVVLKKVRRHIVVVNTNLQI